MTGTHYAERFSQVSSTYITKLFWIASCLESTHDLLELTEDMDDKQIKRSFPDIHDSEFYENYKEDMVEGFINFEKYGFLAEINVPKCTNISFDENGKATSWGVNMGNSRVEYAYGETIEELMTSIESTQKMVFEEYIEAQLKTVSQ